MKRIIITVLMLSIYCVITRGQDTCRYDYRITTLPFQYIFNDFTFTFEKAINNQKTLGLTLGYRPSTQNEAELDFIPHGLIGGYVYQNFWNPLYNAFTIGLNSKYYFSKYNNLFVDGNIFYRLWWFDKKNSSYNNIEEESWSGIRTERQHVYGLKILIGNTFQFRKNKKVKPIIDLYCGIGLRYKMCRFETFNGTFDNYLFLPYKLDVENYWFPSLHIGLRVGLEWRNKGKRK